MGWTLTELDEQDIARILPGLQAQNIRDRLESVVNFVRSGGQSKPTNEDLELYGQITKMLKESENG